MAHCFDILTPTSKEAFCGYNDFAKVFPGFNTEQINKLVTTGTSKNQIHDSYQPLVLSLSL